MGALQEAQAWIDDPHGPLFSSHDCAGAPSRGAVRLHVNRTQAARGG